MDRCHFCGKRIWPWQNRTEVTVYMDTDSTFGYVTHVNLKCVKMRVRVI